MNDTRICATLTRIMRPLAANHHRPQERPRPHQETLHDLREAERLLEWLDETGHTHRRLLMVGKSVVVRWR